MLLPQRLIVAADFQLPDNWLIDGINPLVWYEQQVLQLAAALAGTGVIIKLNTAMRGNYGLIAKLHELGFGVFADLKLFDIPHTLNADADMLRFFQPELLTVALDAGLASVTAITKMLGGITEILGVTILTSINTEECRRLHHVSPERAVIDRIQIGLEADVDGFILSAHEILAARELLGSANKTLNGPGVYPSFSPPGKDQARTASVAQAFSQGLTRCVMGRAIIGARPNDVGKPQNPSEAVDRVLQEIAAVFSVE